VKVIRIGRVHVRHLLGGTVDQSDLGKAVGCQKNQTYGQQTNEQQFRQFHLLYSFLWLAVLATNNARLFNKINQCLSKIKVVKREALIRFQFGIISLTPPD
jgi:hypothetical protein